jgi:hypothetical protein
MGKTKDLSKDCKNIVLNLFKFFQLEKARGRPFYSPDNLIKRTCKAAGISAAGLLSLVEVPEKAIVPFMVNAFDYVTFIHTLKFGNFSDEQGLQNNFNCKYLYNSKMVVKFLTKLVGYAKKKLKVYEIFRFFRFAYLRFTWTILKKEVNSQISIITDF